MRLLLKLFLLLLVVAPIAFVVLAFQPNPTLPDQATLTASQAAQSKSLILEARAAALGQGNGQIKVSEAQLRGLIASAARVVQPLRGRAIIDAGGIQLDFAGQVPHFGQLGWVNLSMTFAPSTDQLEVTSLRVGNMGLPPALTTRIAVTSLDWLSGEDLGSLLVSSIERLETGNGVALITLKDHGDGSDSLFSRVVDGIRSVTGLNDNAAIEDFYGLLAQAATSGELPNRGDFTPWAIFTLSHIGEDQAKLRPALLALAAHCGSTRAVMTMAGNLDLPANSPCRGTVLAGRSDLRQHFTLSAAFQAAGGSTISFGLGEVKELVDAGSSGGSGFSFDDIAADRAGIRFAETAKSIGADQLARRITSQADFMPSIAGLPAFMSDAQFRARYEAVDSPAYQRQLSEIDARINALPAYQ